MRSSLSLLIITALAVVPLARAQTASGQPPADAASQPTATGPSAAQPAAAPAPQRRAASPSRRLHQRHSPPRPATDPAKRKATSDGVLALGATDITGNKELPKVMAIVPWKDSLGAGGVVKPSDSLLDEVLAPVDRGVFQRQVRYYQQLNGSGQTAPAPASADRSGKP